MNLYIIFKKKDIPRGQFDELERVTWKCPRQVV